VQYDIVGNLEIVTLTIAGAVHEGQYELPMYFLAMCREKIWKHWVSGRSND
jgi:hypothetical protein